MPARPETNKQYETVSGQIAQITERLGNTGYGGFILGPTNHYTVWDKDGLSQEEFAYDLLKERKSNARSDKEG